MNKLYKQKNIYTFFICLLLILPTLVLFLDMEWIGGASSLLAIGVFIGFEKGIRDNSKTDEITKYSGWYIFVNDRERIKVSEIEKIIKSSTKIKSSYGLPRSGYSTSVNSFKFQIVVNSETISMLTGSERIVNDVIDKIEKIRRKNSNLNQTPSQMFNF